MAKKKKNKGRIWKWLLAISIGCCVVGLPTAYFGGKYYLRQRTLSWRNQGMAALAANDNDTATDLLTRYIRRIPDDIEALKAYVHAREQVETLNGQNIADTIAALKQLLGVDPDSLADRRHLLNLYMLIRRRPEALDTANAILAKFPKDPATLGIKYEILAALHQNREALFVAEQWIAVAPDELPPLMARVSSQFALAQPRDAIIKNVQELLAKNNDDPKYELLLGYTYASVDNSLEAVAAFKNAAVHCDPKAPYVSLLITQFDQLASSTDTIAMLEDLVQRGAAPDVRHLLGRRHWELGHWEKAVSFFADVNPADNKSDSTLVALKALALASEGNLAECTSIRNALALRKQAVAQAWAIVIPRLIDNSAIDDKGFISQCRLALELDPQNIYLAYFLGDAFSRLGELDLSINAWESIARQKISWSIPATRLVDALLQRGQAEFAHSVAYEAFRRSPTNAAAVALACAWAADVEAGNTSQSPDLLDLINRIQKDIPGEEKTLVIRVGLLANQGNKSEAISAMRAALPQTPPLSEQCLVSLVGVSRKFNLGMEDEIFARAGALYKVTPNISYGRAVNRFLSGDAKGGLQLFDELAKSAPLGEELSWKLARCRYLDVAEDPSANASWASLGNSYPSDLTVQNAIIEARSVHGDWDLMSKTIERLHALTVTKNLDDSGYKWRIAQARMYVRDARNDDDYVHGSLLLSNLIKDFPNMSEPHVLLARALIYMKRADGAIEHLTYAARIDYTSVPIAIELASLLQSRGEFERVQQEIDRIILHLHTAGEHRQIAALLAESGAIDRAMQLMQEGAGGSADPQSDLLRAMLFREKKQTDKVEELIHTMMAKPDLAVINFTVSFYLSQSRTADAEHALAQLDSLKLQPGISDMIWGAYYFQTGNGPKAIERYQAATKNAAGNSGAWRALAATQLVMGKRQEAFTTLAQGAKAIPDDKGLGALVEQTKLLKQAMDDAFLRNVVLLFLTNPLAGEAPVELMKLVIDEQPSNDLQRLAARLQQFIERYPDFLPAQIRLTECFADMHRLNDAYSTAQRAMTVFPTDSESARIATNIAASKGDWSAMRSSAEIWKKRSRDPMADVALARALIKLDQFDAAYDLLQPYLQAATAQPDHFAALLCTYAAVLVNQGRVQQAADLLWPLAQNDPQWRSNWMDITNAIRDFNSALPWLDRVASIIPKDSVHERVALAEAYDILGRRGKDSAIQKKAVDLTFQIANEAEKDLISQLSAAAKASRINDIKLAENYYRRALAIDPNQWIANNNLAMIILNRNGDPKEALSLAQAAIHVQSRDATVFDTYGQAQAQCGDPKSAVESAKTALKMDPDNISYQIRLAEYLLDAGEQTQAITKIREIDQTTRSGNPISVELQGKLESLRKRTRQTG